MGSLFNFETSRIGQEQIGEIIASSDLNLVNINTATQNIIGDKYFEMSNHLGNVLEVVSDRKLPVNDGNGNIDYFLADVVSYSDYYPGGMMLPGRSGNANSYDYGFNGMLKDDEIKGEGNSYDFGARMYDPRIMRWLTRDPLEDKYPYLSPYNFVANTPIQAVDPDGRYIIFINGYNVSDVIVGPFLPGWSVGIKNKSAAKSLDFAENAYDFSNAGGHIGANYWKGFDRGAMKKWGDYKAQYVDGSPTFGMQDIDDDFRIAAGKSQGRNDAKSILKNLDEGETIKIVTHSMGGAFGRGYVEGLSEGLAYQVGLHNAVVSIEKAAAFLKGVEYNGPGYMAVPKIERVVDIAPFSGNSKSGYEAVHPNTFQMSGDNDGISGNVLWPGAETIPTKPGTGHSIEEYNANDLPTSRPSFE